MNDIESYIIPAPQEKITIEGPGPLNPIGTPKVPLDFTRPLQTKGGQRVTIYAIDYRWNKPIIGYGNPVIGVCQWGIDGRFMGTGEDSCLDLENVPEVVV